MKYCTGSLYICSIISQHFITNFYEYLDIKLQALHICKLLKLTVVVNIHLSTSYSLYHFVVMYHMAPAYVREVYTTNAFQNV